jgi:hypothetical protein
MIKTLLVLLTVAVSASAPGPDASVTSSEMATPVSSVSECLLAPDYYQIKLVGTQKVRGARTARGLGAVSFAQSPFGVAISASGTYVVNLDLAMENVTLAPGKSLVAWVSTPQVDQIKLLGRFDEAFTVSGSTAWNKFLVVITLESADEPLGEMWSGPIVARGMSRSGLMHTMAGHGPFEAEPCAVYGY